MNLKPLDDRIVVKPNEAETQTASGLVIPDTAKEKPQQAIVVAVGAGKRLKDGSRKPSALSEGDAILFGKYSGDEIKLDGEAHLILREDEVLAIIED